MSDLPATESLTVEFKSDEKRLSDHGLVEAVVCLANTDGGTLYLGVEDDGRATGLHTKRELDGCAALIANQTAPSVRVRVRELETAGVRVAAIDVPRSLQPVATTRGVMKRRRLDVHGKPECVPFLPTEIPSRLSDLGALDSSAQAVEGATLAELDPVERARVRQFVERFRGDPALLELSDEELDGALGLTKGVGHDRVPSLAGLLLIGRENALARLVPTHEVAFQVLEGASVRFNEFRRWPLLRLVEWLDAQFSSRNPEEEMQVGLFRVGVPRVDFSAYREALANALTHRDYARLGAVHLILDGEALTVSNPGGFIDGVTPRNILTTPPRPRNPRLADAFKRIGLVERTGRGVDLIYAQTARYGRPLPSYTQSTSASVVLRIPAAEADLSFLRMVLEAERERGGPLPVDSLIVLSSLRTERRADIGELSEALQKDRTATKRTLETLVEAGLVAPHGSGRGRYYTLSAQVYDEQGHRAAFVRQAGFTRMQREEMVMRHVQSYGQIRRREVMELTRLDGPQSTRLLSRLVKAGRLRRVGERRAAHYVLPEGQDDA